MRKSSLVDNITSVRALADNTKAHDKAHELTGELLFQHFSVLVGRTVTSIAIILLPLLDDTHHLCIAQDAIIGGDYFHT